MELNQDFLAEKSRLERRLAQIDIELGERAEPLEQAALMIDKQHNCVIDINHWALAIKISGCRHDPFLVVAFCGLSNPQ